MEKRGEKDVLSWAKTPPYFILLPGWKRFTHSHTLQITVLKFIQQKVERDENENLRKQQNSQILFKGHDQLIYYIFRWPQFE